MHQESDGSCGIYEIYNYGLLLFITDMLHLTQPLSSPALAILSCYPLITFMTFVTI